MVFLNRVTQEMTVKIVYYGPGLCGKTTNLQQIYQKTSPDTRGEMVSLETEADRTLFFDLLPIEVGRIGGYRTRLQLYTVPGQVFYNTTRKVVLKGVDGIVFVADSQREMLDANLESLRNLKENLDELGINLDDIPMVFQYNKEDLPNSLGKAELDQHLNKKSFPSFEAVAVRGDGVFETLKQISKETLKHLRKKLSSPVSPPPARAIPPAPPPGAQKSAASADTSPPTPSTNRPLPPPPSFHADQSKDQVDLIQEDMTPPIETDVMEPELSMDDGIEVELDPDMEADPELEPDLGEAPDVAEDESDREDISFDQSGTQDKNVEVRRVKVKHSLDVLAELEKLKRDSGSIKRDVSRKTRTIGTSEAMEDLLLKTANHKKEISKSFDLSVSKKALASAQHVRVILQFADNNDKPILELKDIDIDLKGSRNIIQLLLDLSIKLQGQ